MEHEKKQRAEELAKAKQKAAISRWLSATLMCLTPVQASSHGDGHLQPSGVHSAQEKVWPPDWAAGSLEYMRRVFDWRMHMGGATP